MNNLIQNYKIILKELKETCKNIPTKKKIRKPKLSDMELVALNITAEYMSINSELQLFRCIAGTELDSKIERSVYNKRKRKLFSYIEKIKYFGYKLHAVCDKNGIFHSFDFTPANVHDVNYLKDIKEDFKNCELIGDRGYISKEIQLDLFNCSNINLSVPMRKNQHDFVAFPKVKSRIRKRIETNFSQLCGQFLMGINLAKTFQGFITRILSKITSFTMIQYLNFFVFKRDLNKIKVNLC
uniref:IS982 family transposase n=1 Tax=Ornithobacterium rhinotracheale TaxID=28251 RepID=UPI0039A6CAD2